MHESPEVNHEKLVRPAPEHRAVVSLQSEVSQ